MDELEKLKSEVARMSKENLDLHQENKNHRIKRKSTQKELDALKTEHEALAEQLKDVESKTNHDEKWKGKFEELQGKVRETNHKKAFDEVALSLKVRPEAIDDLWRLSGYHPEGDEPDAEAIKGVVAPLVESRPFYLVPDAPAEAKPKLPPGPNLNRPRLDGQPKIQVRMSQMRDFGFVKEFGKEIAAGFNRGTHELVKD